MLKRADCLKFVMSAPENKKYQSYSVVPEWAHDWHQKTGKPVFVSPMNIYLKHPLSANTLNLPEQGIEDRSEINERISFWEPGLLDLKQNQLNHEYVALYCMNHGFTFNVQLHLFANLP
jgi:7-carboxy-7-deazaguanine synthase